MTGIFLLPRLKDNSSGSWSPQDVKDPYTTLADALEFARTKEVVSVNSIPTVWARPLLFDSVLHGSNRHPLYENTTSQWRGMLAAIALAEYFERSGNKLSVSFLDLTTSNQGFIKAVRRVVPTSSDRWLYKEGLSNPWYKFYIFYWNNQPVGMTSPSTIVFPATEGNWVGLPWFNNGVLEDPTEYLTKNDIKLAEILAKWLKDLVISIQDEKYGGNRSAREQIQDVLNSFIGDLGFSEKFSSIQILTDEQRVNKEDFFGAMFNFAFFHKLLPIKLSETTPSLFTKDLSFNKEIPEPINPCLHPKIRTQEQLKEISKDFCLIIAFTEELFPEDWDEWQHWISDIMESRTRMQSKGMNHRLVSLITFYRLIRFAFHIGIDKVYILATRRTTR